MNTSKIEALVTALNTKNTSDYVISAIHNCTIKELEEAHILMKKRFEDSLIESGSDYLYFDSYGLIKTIEFTVGSVNSLLSKMLKAWNPPRYRCYDKKEHDEAFELIINYLQDMLLIVLHTQKAKVIRNNNCMGGDGGILRLKGLREYLRRLVWKL